jgi:hypothetical protein
MLILDDDLDFLIKYVITAEKLYESISVGIKGLLNVENDIFKLRLQSFADESEKIDPVLHKQFQMDFIIIRLGKNKSLPRKADPAEEDCSRSFKKSL